MTSTPQPKIGIIGAGPVSLTLANILQNNNIAFTVFEAADQFRTTGGSLDLHPEAGQLALREAGLWDAFVKHSRPEADCDKIVSMDGEVLWDENLLKRDDKSEEEKFAGRPEIDRKSLMKILFDNVLSENVSFGKKLDHMTPSTTRPSKHTLHFADGTQDTDYDLIIGGDGAWSKVRTLLSDVKPQYSGVSMVEVNCHDIKANQWLLDYIGIGSMFSFGEGRAVLSQRQGDGSLRTYACLRVPEEFLETCGIDWKDEHTARKQWIERYFSDVGKDLKRVVLDSKDSSIPRALYELPVGFGWSHCTGVTLIGDAAHLMTPFAGIGVNVGMTDALILSREIIAASKGEKGWEEAIQSYEKEMFPRARKYMEKTERGKKNHFSANGAETFANMMKAHHQPA